MKAWEAQLSALVKQYEPESIVVRSGLYSARWHHMAAESGAWVELWYRDAGGQFERLVRSAIPYSFPHDRLGWLFAEKMRAAENMLEGTFCA